MFYLNTTTENLGNQLDCQEQYLWGNCMLTPCISKTQCENTDDISLSTINQHFKLELTETEQYWAHRNGNPK